MAANERREPVEVLAIGTPQPAFSSQVTDLYGGTRGEAMLGAEDESELFGEEWPAIETLPGIPEVCGDGELGAARLEKLDDLGRRAAQQFQLEAVEQPVELGQVGGQQLEIDRAGNGKPQRAQLAALDGGGQRARAERALVALLEQRIHALAELGQLGMRPFAAEQIAAELLFKLLDGTGQRRLRHVARLCSLGEIALADRRQEVPDLVHFHSGILSSC